MPILGLLLLATNYPPAGGGLGEPSGFEGFAFAQCPIGGTLVFAIFALRLNRLQFSAQLSDTTLRLRISIVWTRE